jgi:hypothetical protein
MTEMVKNIISSFMEENQENLLASSKKESFAVIIFRGTPWWQGAN